ncbi:MAG TPA: SDR family NAD(P)-dependent oxidoreductase [Acetobacteraceae bacterium]|nr:SDR family NAD(P)-dependent oxidoreductase [Acetobacteraceae bacterium]
MTPNLLIFGLGYCGAAVAGAARDAGFVVTGTARGAPGAGAIPFDAAAPGIAEATHLLSTVPPDARDGTGTRVAGDPVLARYADAIAAAPHLRWIGYLSSTVVYGDRGGGWVDEDTPPAPSQERGHRRLAAETAWRAFAAGRAVDIFRLAGIYGPGRSAFDTIHSGQARRIVKPGHAFGRIHRDDIAGAVLSAMRQDRAPGPRILNLADDTPAETATVIEEAARLLGVPPPPAVAFATAAPAMSPMARSFWAENRKVASCKTQSMLAFAWRYPSYREGLPAVLRQENSTHNLA